MRLVEIARFNNDVADMVSFALLPGSGWQAHQVDRAGKE